MRFCTLQSLVKNYFILHNFTILLKFLSFRSIETFFAYTVVYDVHNEHVLVIILLYLSYLL